MSVALMLQVTSFFSFLNWFVTLLFFITWFLTFLFWHLQQSSALNVCAHMDTCL
jgi:hypothetical protein